MPSLDLLSLAERWGELAPNLNSAGGGECWPSPMRVDSWQNPLMGFGTSRDKTTATRFAASWTLQQQELINLFRHDDIARKICEEYPDQALREGYTLTAKTSPEVLAALKSDAEDLGFEEEISTAACWARLTGGAAILIGADDGQPIAAPLNEKGIRRVDYLLTLDRFCLYPSEYYQDPALPRKYGKPMRYRIMALSPLGNAVPGVDPGLEVHESRVVLFRGQRTDRLTRLHLQGWEDSVLQVVYAVLQDFASAWASSTALMSDFGQGVMKVRDFYKALASAEGQKTLAERGRIIDITRSSGRFIMVDKDGEDFTRVPTPITGLSDLIDRYCQRMSAASGLSITRMFGISPAGMNATGESDTRQDYDRIAAWRTKRLVAPMKRVLNIIALSKGGPTGGRVPEYELSFPSLWQPTAVEKANIQKTHAETDAIRVQSQVCLPEECAQSRFSGSEYDYSGGTVQIDLTLRKQVEAEQSEASRQQQEDVELEGELRSRGFKGAEPSGEDLRGLLRSDDDDDVFDNPLDHLLG